MAHERSDGRLFWRPPLSPEQSPVLSTTVPFAPAHTPRVMTLGNFATSWNYGRRCRLVIMERRRVEGTTQYLNERCRNWRVAEMGRRMGCFPFAQINPELGASPVGPPRELGPPHTAPSTAAAAATAAAPGVLTPILPSDDDYRKEEESSDDEPPREPPPTLPPGIRSSGRCSCRMKCYHPIEQGHEPYCLYCDPVHCPEGCCCPCAMCYPDTDSTRPQDLLPPLPSSGNSICYSCRARISAGARSCSSCGAIEVPVTPSRRNFPSTFEANSQQVTRHAGRESVLASDAQVRNQELPVSPTVTIQASLSRSSWQQGLAIRAQRPRTWGPELPDDPIESPDDPIEATQVVRSSSRCNGGRHLGAYRYLWDHLSPSRSRSRS